MGVATRTRRWSATGNGWQRRHVFRFGEHGASYPASKLPGDHAQDGDATDERGKLCLAAHVDSFAAQQAYADAQAGQTLLVQGTPTRFKSAKFPFSSTRWYLPLAKASLACLAPASPESLR